MSAIFRIVLEIRVGENCSPLGVSTLILHLVEIRLCLEIIALARVEEEHVIIHLVLCLCFWEVTEQAHERFLG